MKSIDIITASVVDEIFVNHPEVIYDAVRIGYERHQAGKTVNPPSYFLRFPDKPDARIIALPAAITSEPAIAGIKWIASYPDNIKHGLKRAAALIILNDYQNGYPVACLEGAVISALRTVLSALIVVDALCTDKYIARMGIVGTGNISLTWLRSLKLLGWKLGHIYLHDITLAYAQTFADQIADIYPDIPIQLGTMGATLSQSDVILFATTSATPHVRDVSDFTHNPLVLHLSLRDLAPDVLITANNIVDDIEHVLHANTSPHLAQQQYGHTDFINGTIGALLANTITLAPNKPTIFSPMGMGILDLALSERLYKMAKAQHRVTTIPNFFS